MDDIAEAPRSVSGACTATAYDCSQGKSGSSRVVATDDLLSRYWSGLVSLCLSEWPIAGHRIGVVWSVIGLDHT